MRYCERCGGEGKLYTSRYGGNDPDVWPTGECPVCEGSGWDREAEAREECARRGIDPDDICADGGVTAWMVVEKELRDGREQATD